MTSLCLFVQLADRTLIIAKGVFIPSWSTLVFFRTTRLASGFLNTKKPGFRFITRSRAILDTPCIWCYYFAVTVCTAIPSGRRWCSFVFWSGYPFTILDWWQHLCHRFLDDKDFRTSAKEKGLMPQPSVLSFPCRQWLIKKDPYIAVRVFLVHHRGLEPRTHWLRVSCSTNWANGAYEDFRRFSVKSCFE